MYSYMIVLSVQGQDVLLRANRNDASWIDLNILIQYRVYHLMFKIEELHSRLSATSSNVSLYDQSLSSS